MDEHTKRNREAFDNSNAVAQDSPFVDQDQKIELVCREIAVRGPFQRGLDVGCHTGVAGVRYKVAGVAHLTGVDLSEAALDVARRRGFEETRRWVVGAERAPFEDDSFDLIIMGDVLEHVVNTDFALSEIRRCLVPAGRLIVTTPNLAYWWSRVRLLCGRAPVSLGGVSSMFKVDARIDQNHIRLGCLSEWRGFLRHHAFSVQHVGGWSLGHYPMKHVAFIGRISRILDRILVTHAEFAFGLLLSAENMPKQ